MTHKILVLPGDGIGPEIVAEAVKVLDVFVAEGALNLQLDYAYRINNHEIFNDDHIVSMILRF